MSFLSKVFRSNKKETSASHSRLSSETVSEPPPYSDKTDKSDVKVLKKNFTVRTSVEDIKELLMQCYKTNDTKRLKEYISYVFPDHLNTVMCSYCRDGEFELVKFVMTETPSDVVMFKVNDLLEGALETHQLDICFYLLNSYPRNWGSFIMEVAKRDDKITMKRISEL